ncbi:hypothetical protein, partial [Escherichia coli]|uniref:hypothetical protein n=1 Tax=Escherichia coli TaxID=562 RepID=UPI001BFD4D18
MAIDVTASLLYSSEAGNVSETQDVYKGLSCGRTGEPFSQFAFCFLITKITMLVVIALSFNIGRKQT